MAVAKPDALVTLALRAFFGMRTEELSPLWWVLIKAPDGYITVTLVPFL